MTVLVRWAWNGRVPQRALPCLPLTLCAWGVVLAAQGAWIPAKAALAQVLLERSFAVGLASGRPERPWPWADSAPVARVTVPRLGVREIVMSGGSGQALAFGPTVLQPGGAEGFDGVTILAAHRDTHFRFMRELREGDHVTVEGIDGASRRYRVTHLETVQWNRFGYPFAPPRRMLALVTCYPFDGGRNTPLRRIAWAEEVEAHQADAG